MKQPRWHKGKSLLVLLAMLLAAPSQSRADWQLVWSDEFDREQFLEFGGLVVHQCAGDIGPLSLDRVAGEPGFC